MKTPKEQSETNEGLCFDYAISYDARRQNLWIKIFHNGKIITRFERYGINVFNLNDRSITSSVLNYSHRFFIQHLLRFGQVDSWENCYVVPRAQAGFFIGKLNKFEKVTQLQDGKVVSFAESSLAFKVKLKSENLVPLKLEASFFDPQNNKKIAFAASVIFPSSRPWILFQGSYYPIRHSLVTDLLPEFDAEGNLEIKGGRAAKFFEEEFGVLVEQQEIEVPEGFISPLFERFDPEPRCQISEDRKKEELTLTLQFAYGPHLLIPYQNEQDIVAERMHEGKKVILCRNLSFEKSILEKFIKQGFKRVGPDLFSTGGDQALDFVSTVLPELKEEAEVSGEDSLKRFQVFTHLGGEQLSAKASFPSMDWFSLDLKFSVDDWEVSFETILALAQQDKRYLYVPGKGYARIDKEEILKIQQSLEELEAKKDEQGLLKLSRFHAPYLDSLFKINWQGEEALHQALDRFRLHEGIQEKPIPATLKATLRDYQKQGFAWLHFLKDHNFHGVLADDMGLGKTVQALAYLLDQRIEKGQAPCLVLAPTSVVFNWGAESEKFTPELTTILYTGDQRKKFRDQLTQVDIVLTSYALFRREAEMFQSIKWRTLILDEAQNIKNHRSKTAALVKEIKASQRFALTGTPLENSLAELWSIFDFLMPGFLGSHTHFKRTYEKPIESDQSQDSLDRLRRRIFPFVLRRHKSEVAKELPPKTEIQQFCEMSEEQAKLYKEILLSSRKMVFDEVEYKGIEKSQVSILTALLRLRQISCHPYLLGDRFLKGRKIESGKFENFKELLQEIISEKHRVIVFSQFVEMLGVLRRWMDEEKIVYEYLDGRTRKREEHIKNFQTNPDIPVFLISLKAGGTGLNLTEADYVIHYDPWWNPAVEDQATDRVHRIGQTKQVFSYKLITKGSVEEKILTLQERKRNLFLGVMKSDSPLGKKLTVEDLEYLFS
ncbi:MAG: SNF2 helicase associated domain-containing protein [Deltaproteobacteria bacterium]|nr:SNF2 helicase associated domain-containing protein [Deltaproteobacteria bacterium]